MRVTSIGILGLALSFVLGCSTSLPSRLDRNWGSAQRENMEAMIVNPAGSKPDHDPTAETDGVTVEHAMEGHRAGEMRKKRQRPAQSVINIGTVSR